MRIVLSMLDLAAPYVNIYEEEIVSDQLNIKWKVGGSTKVNFCQLYYTYV